MEAEVRTDKGKFVSTSWRKLVSDRYLWIVIGFGETIKTGCWDGDPCPSSLIIKGGPLYQLVDAGNRSLIAAEPTLSPDECEFHRERHKLSDDHHRPRRRHFPHRPIIRFPAEHHSAIRRRKARLADSRSAQAS